MLFRQIHNFFFGGKPSIIFLIVSSPTSWKLNWLMFSSTLIKYDAKSLFVLLCIYLARLEHIFVKYKFNLFAISNVSVTITCSSLKYVGAIPLAAANMIHL